MRSVSSSLPSQLPSPPQPGLQALRRPLPETSTRNLAAPSISGTVANGAAQAPFQAGKSSDSATFSSDGQALLNQPEAQQKKILSLLDEMFGITNVASMSLIIDVSHAHSLQTSSREQQYSGASGVSYDYQDSSHESAYTALRAAGTITLDDGRTFNLDLSYERAVVVTSQRSLSFSSDAPPADATTPLDLTGSGKRLLDRLFPPATIAKNLADALRQLTQASSPYESDASVDTPPSLIVSLEVSALSTQSLNAVFSHLRDLRQQRQAETYLLTKSTEPQLDVVS